MSGKVRTFWSSFGFDELRLWVLDLPIVALAIVVGNAIRHDAEPYALPYLGDVSVSAVTQSYIHNLVIPALMLVWRLALNLFVLRKELRNSGAFAMALYFVWAVGSTTEGKFEEYKLASSWTDYVPPILWILGSKIAWRVVKSEREKKEMAGVPDGALPGWD